MNIMDMGYQRYRIRRILSDYRKLLVISDLFATEGNLLCDVISLVEDLLPAFEAAKDENGDFSDAYDDLREYARTTTDDEELTAILLGEKRVDDERLKVPIDPMTCTQRRINMQIKCIKMDVKTSGCSLI